MTRLLAAAALATLAAAAGLYAGALAGLTVTSAGWKP